MRLEIFHAVLEQGSFSGAARVLGLSAPMVSRQVADLEAHLGPVNHLGGVAEQAKAEAGAVGTGAGARGAVRGAAAGALIGEIASDDAGKGAAYGAAAGAIGGRRRARRARSEAQSQVEVQAAQAQQATAEQLENFKKAFSVCLEAKQYLVKF